MRGPTAPGAAIMGGDEAGAAVIEGNAPDPEASGIGLTGTGLRPPLPISTEPIGIPAVAPRPPDAVDIADDDTAPPAELVPHVPDVGMLPGNGIPIVIPPPSEVVVVPDIPEDELARAGHATPLPVIPIEPVGIGLSPADGSSVAPIGSPVGGTGVPAVMPSGEVVAIPGSVVPICATAGWQPNSAANIKAINAARILPCMAMRPRSARDRAHRPKVTLRSSLIARRSE
jgi:hypothetical protein